MVFCVSFDCLFHFLKVCLISLVLSVSIVFGVECCACVFVVFFARLTSKSRVVKTVICFCFAIFRIIFLRSFSVSFSS